MAENVTVFSVNVSLNFVRKKYTQKLFPYYNPFLILNKISAALILRRIF